jgi:hypothetical protein
MPISIYCVKCYFFKELWHLAFGNAGEGSWTLHGGTRVLHASARLALQTGPV